MHFNSARPSPCACDAWMDRIDSEGGKPVRPCSGESWMLHMLTFPLVQARFPILDWSIDPRWRMYFAQAFPTSEWPRVETGFIKSWLIYLCVWLCFTSCASADGKRKQHLGSNEASIDWSWPWKAPCWCGFYKSKLLRQPINLDRSTSCLWAVFEKSFSWWNILGLGLTQVLVATAWASFHLEHEQ